MGSLESNVGFRSVELPNVYVHLGVVERAEQVVDESDHGQWHGVRTQVGLQAAQFSVQGNKADTCTQGQMTEENSAKYYLEQHKICIQIYSEIFSNRTIFNSVCY